MVHKGKDNSLADFQTSFAEVDFHLSIHVLDSLKAGHKVCVVIANDTDVIVALLYHMPVFLHHYI
jgi:hypothetical protein